MDSAQRRLLFELRTLQKAGLTVLPARPGEVADEGAPRPDLRPSPVDGSESEPLQDRVRSLQQVAEAVTSCTRCGLCETRNQAVPGEGALDPPILFIGEGPGAEEDRTGRPFVGPAGQLLDKMIAAIGLRREEVFIANIVKCRPPGNRTPLPDEVQRCLPFLLEQIRWLKPRLICTLGLPATRTLIPEVKAISAARGKEMQYEGVPLIPTFHPAYLLRNPSAKRQAWEDLKKVARLALHRVIP